MADLHKFTTKEVLNKVLLDSSGNAVAALSHTTQEALNAVLDSANSRLNVSLVGGTISGDVTITGDLTVNSGTSTLVFDESVVGDMSIKGADGGTLFLQTSDTNVADNDVLGRIHFQAPDEANGSDAILVGASIHAEATGFFQAGDNPTDLVFSTGSSEAATPKMRITSDGRVGIGNEGVAGVALNVTGKIRVSDKIEVSGNNFIIQTATVTAIDGASDAANMQFQNAASTGDSHRGFVFSAAKTFSHIDGQGNLLFKSTTDSGSSLGDGASLYLQKDDGAAMANDHVLGEIIFQGAEDASNNLITGARIFAENSRGSDWDSSNNHCDLVFQTTSGDNTLTEAMRIEDTGKIVMSPTDGQPVEIKPRSGISTVFSLKNASDSTLIGFHCALSTLSGHTNKPAFFASNDFQIFTTGSKTMSFGTNSVTRFQLDDDSRISLSNNAGGNNNTVFGKLAGADLTSDADHATLFGEQAGTNSTSGDFNTAIGSLSLHGSDGTAHTGTNNTALGYKAGFNIQGAASYNTFIGVEAGSGFNSTANDHNTAIGYQAGVGGNNQDIDDIVAVGSQALSNIDNNAADGSVAVGRSALAALTSGASNTAVGYQALKTPTTEAQSVSIGYQSMGNCSNGSNNVMVGYFSGKNMTAGNDNNTGIGHTALGGTHGGASEKNTAIGSLAMAGAINGGANNTAVGFSAGTAITSGDNNTVIGSNAGLGITSNGGNTAVGYKSFHNVGNASGTNNVAIGYEALMGGTGTATDNDANSSVAIGYQALMDVVDADHNIAIGYLASTNIVGGESNIAIGSSALTAGTNNTGNIAIGLSALSSASDGENYNIAIGFQAMQSVNATTTDHNIAMGQQAGKALSGNNNIALGQGAMNNSSNAVDGTIAIGKFAAQGAMTSGADSTIAIGQLALQSLTSGSENTAIGFQTMKNATTAEYNVALGYNTLGGAASTAHTGNSNTAIGAYALADMNDNGAFNTAIGNQALEEVTNGKYNTALGSYAGDNVTTGEGNTYLGYYALPSAADVDDEIVLKAGVDSFTGAGTETIRIGVDSDYITNDFGENATWTHSSDRRIKKDIEDSELGLDFINDLRPVTFKKKAPSEYPQEFDQYNADKTERSNPNKKHYGFIAQEVKEAMDKAGHLDFPVWKENKDGMQELGETELITPLIKAVQELSSKVKELEAKLSK